MQIVSANPVLAILLHSSIMHFDLQVTVSTDSVTTDIHILQINNISNKHEELKQLAHTIQPYIITVQEIKIIKKTSETPNINLHTLQ